LDALRAAVEFTACGDQPRLPVILPILCLPPM
jgi:hypothetical protein